MGKTVVLCCYLTVQTAAEHFSEKCRAKNICASCISEHYSEEYTTIHRNSKQRNSVGVVMRTMGKREKQVKTVSEQNNISIEEKCYRINRSWIGWGAWGQGHL